MRNATIRYTLIQTNLLEHFFYFFLYFNDNYLCDVIFELISVYLSFCLSSCRAWRVNSYDFHYIYISILDHFMYRH